MVQKSEKWELVAIAQDRSVVCALPADGSVVIGRGGAGAVDLAVDDPSVSRRHATFEIRGGTITVEDLGSANGTRIVEVIADAQRTAQTVAKELAPGQKFIVPPTASVHLGEVTVLLRRASELAARERKGDPEVIARSPAMKHVLGLLERIAQSPLSVLLVGETGVGKDVMARTVHAASPQSDGPFVAINCAALSEQLLESELFGHEKGAFTGALGAKVGLLEAASGGTAFLDEVGELPLTQQSKLLRALEAKEVLRVGALKPRPIDARFVSATNRDPSREDGSFRRDLYFRLSGITVAIPPLRDRPEDLEPLAMLFAKRAAAALKRASPTFAEEALVRLRRHTFPGNIRELRNVVDRAVALSTNDIIEASHLLIDAVHTTAKTDGHVGDPRDTERQQILDALNQCAGNQTRAAALLGISRRTLVSRLGEYGIARPRSNRDD